LTDPAPFEAAIKESERARLGEVVDVVLLESMQKRLDQPPTPEEARLAELAVQRAAIARDWRRCRELLKKFESREIAWLAAVVPYVNELTKSGHQPTVRRLMRKHGDKLKRDTRVWGAIGYALLNGAKFGSQYRRVVKWLGDYSPRLDARPWMLANLSTSLRWLGRDSAAYAVSRHALGLVEDQTTAQHIVWMALDELIMSKPGEGASRFLSVDKQALPAKYQFLAQIVDAVMEFDRQLPTARQAAAATARQMLVAARRKYPRYARSRDLKRKFRRVVWQMARKTGGLRMRLWAACQM
jgi:hypothetical protein